MAITVDIGGVNYSVPETGERSWGQNTTDLLVALADASYLIRGGSIPLVSEADFGPTAGLKAVWFASRSGNEAATGVVRLANLDGVNWRNAANDGDNTLTVNASDELTYNGSKLAIESEIPVTSVHGRTGDVVSDTNDYTWAQIDKTTSDIADITTKSHTSLTDIGTNTHAQIDTHIADTANPHSVTATQVGLGNVDNTSDADKPVSTATQAALDLKQDDVITTRGDVIRGDATGAAERLPIGTNNQVLTSDGTDVSWQDPTGGLTDPMTTRGDIIVRDATNTTARLGVGTNGQVLKSDGTDIEWGDAESGSGKNYIINPSAVADATTGVSNTATTGSWTVARTTTAAELPEESVGSAFKISGSGLTVGDTVELAIIATGIDDADGGRFGTARVAVKDISGSINGQYSIQVYSVTDSVYVGDEETITGTGTYYLDVPLVAENDYEFHLVAQTTSPTDIGLSSVTIEPSSQTTAGVIGKWQSYTPSNTQGFGTITSRLQWRINGQSIEIQGDYTVGTVSGVEARISLPNGYTISQENALSTFIIGDWARSVNNNSVFQWVVLGLDGTNHLKFGRKYTAGSSSLLVARDADEIVGSGERITVKVSVPVAELANAHTPTASDVQYENARAMYDLSGTTSGGTSITLTESSDVSSVGFTESSNVITVKFKGTVSLEGQIKSNTTFSSNGFINLYKNNSFVRSIGRAISGGVNVSFQYLIDCDVDDTLDIRPGGSIGVIDPDDVSTLIVTRHSDYSARKASLPFDTWQDKTVDSNQTSDGTVLTFNNLEIGKYYRLSGTFACLTQAADSAVRVLLNHDSTLLDAGRVQPNQATTATNSIRLSAVFKATATTATVDTSSASANAYIQADGANERSFATLEELPMYSGPTTKFT